MRTLTFIIAVMLAAFMMGCGNDDEESSSPTVEEKSVEEKSQPPLGLDGDTYRNQQYVVKVSNLSIDDWTVLVESNPKDNVKIREWHAESVAGEPGFSNTGKTLILTSVRYNGAGTPSAIIR